MNARRLTFLAFFLAIFFMSAQRIETKYVMLAWDSSFSMENRVVERDFKFLENYFERNQNVRINLVLFSNAVLGNSDFEVSMGDWSAIKKKLEHSVYDGATNFKVVERLISLEHTELLLFTDGAQSFGSQTPNFGIKTLLVNSNPYKDQMDLNAILVSNKARLFDYGRPIFSQPEAKNTMDGNNRNTQISSSNDTLLPGPGIGLKEVVVSENKRVENPVTTVNMGNGEVDKNRVGVAVQSIGDAEISPIQTDVAQSVQGKFSGVEVKRNNDLSQVKMRTDNSMVLNNYGLIVIDGIPQQRSNSVPNNNDPLAAFGHIDPENIADITVLKGMAATTRYGTLGANGVVLITTKNSKGREVLATSVDRARLKNNIYDGDLSNTKKKGDPIYIKELKSIKNVDDAYAQYLVQRSEHLNAPDYFIKVYDHFKSMDPTIADRILSNISELNAKNISQLRILAYKYEVEDDFDKALKINEQILSLDEHSAQAKLDVALSAEELRKFDQAYDQLSELVRNNSPSIDFSGLKKSASNALRNILNTPGTSISVDEADKKYMNKVHYDARILVMWSKSNAQFELQIINPDKRFFSWEHSEIEDKQRFLADIKNDTNTEEFHLIDAQKGDWFIKVNNLNEFETVDPVFLKCVIYYNFGKPDQRKELQILDLTNSDTVTSLFKITL